MVVVHNEVTAWPKLVGAFYHLVIWALTGLTWTLDDCLLVSACLTWHGRGPLTWLIIGEKNSREGPCEPSPGRNSSRFCLTAGQRPSCGLVRWNAFALKTTPNSNIAATTPNFTIETLLLPRGKISWKSETAFDAVRVHACISTKVWRIRWGTFIHW